ncbi:methyltransferase [Ancylobacter sp.]|uniref:methyltransferase n=1 Tax=Ancylobacter sp. TaxID=1872567 RepID=UPI003D12EB4F
MNVDQSTLAVLAGAECQGNALTLVGQLDRKAYEAVNKVIAAAGGKWNRSAKAHIFDGDAAEVIEPILLTGVVQRTKQDFGQFDSPPAVVARVMELARIGPRMKVLEPSAGVGNIALAAAAWGAQVMCYEVDERRCNALVKASSQAAHRLDMVIQRDFLGADPVPVYDRVVMNPPFAKQADIAHVMHAAGFVRPGGRLVSVMGAGVSFRQDRRASEFRAFIARQGGSIEALPDESFRDSGTSVNAVIVSLDVPAALSEPRHD